MKLTWFQTALRRMAFWRKPTLELESLEIVDAGMIRVFFSQALKTLLIARITLWKKEGLHLTIMTYPDRVTILDLHQGRCQITNSYYSQSEGCNVTIPMDRELAKALVAKARKYLQRNHVHDYSWDSVAHRMYKAMGAIDWGS